jgi:hypothetical protein
MFVVIGVMSRTFFWFIALYMLSHVTFQRSLQVTQTVIRRVITCSMAIRFAAAALGKVNFGCLSTAVLPYELNLVLGKRTR